MVVQPTGKFSGKAAGLQVWGDHDQAVEDVGGFAIERGQRYAEQRSGVGKLFGREQPFVRGEQGGEFARGGAEGGVLLYLVWGDTGGTQFQQRVAERGAESQAVGELLECLADALRGDARFQGAVDQRGLFYVADLAQALFRERHEGELLGNTAKIGRFPADPTLGLAGERGEEFAAEVQVGGEEEFAGVRGLRGDACERGEQRGLP